MKHCRRFYGLLPKLVLAPDVCGAVLCVGDLDGDDGPRLGGVVVIVGVANGDQIWRGNGEEYLEKSSLAVLREYL